MDCFLSPTIDIIKAAVMKQVDEDNICMQAIIDLAMLFDKASTTDDDMIKAYKECKDISEERLIQYQKYKQKNDRHKHKYSQLEHTSDSCELHGDKEQNVLAHVPTIVVRDTKRQMQQVGTWSSGVILALGARGPEFFYV
ncbi:hypothetical protein Tco_1051382 [Tanacetum coccineum]